MAEVIWTDPALAQLDSIADYSALDKPDAAQAVVRRVFDAIDNLGQFIALGRKVPEFDHPTYRQVWMKPCWIYYRIDGDRVVVLHVRRAERPLRVEDLLEP